ncbi:hypothetical protein A2G94_03760 [Francisella endosymbiont of Ornithodoros moubata]|nr:hypothetical protein A2G94_03760 [Francisella endosymbiont of Ornithodoros moubata]
MIQILKHISINTGDDLSEHKFLTDSYNIKIGNISPNISNYLKIDLGTSCFVTCYQNNTDYIVIKAETSSTNLANSTLYLDSTNGINAADYLALCNSGQIDLIKVSNVDKSNDITLSQPATGQYIVDDYVCKFEIFLFYIGGSGRVDNYVNTIYSLFLYIKHSSSMGQNYELVSGIENLKVSYTTIENNQIIWHNISGDTDVGTLGTYALKFSFTI